MPRGRPRTQVTAAQWRTIERMAADMCTAQEIADYLGISRRTLYERHLRDRFDGIMRRKHAATRWRLRRRQIEQAKKCGTNPVPLIWTGKQYLGQRDRPEEAPLGGAAQAMSDLGQRLAELLDRAAKVKGKP